MSRVRNLRKRGRDVGPARPLVDSDAAAVARDRKRAERILREARLSDDDAAAWTAFIGPSTGRADRTSSSTLSGRPSSAQAATTGSIPSDAGASSAAVSDRLAPETLAILARSGIGAGGVKPPTMSTPFRDVAATQNLPRPMSRKIARGAVLIEGRIDLHGLTRDGAYHALFEYLRAAQMRGQHTILVITGKGLDEVDIRHRPFDADLDRPARGVLKRAVPEWLRSSAFATLVRGFGPAHPRHGGAGALYVELHRPRLSR